MCSFPDGNIVLEQVEIEMKACGLCHTDSKFPTRNFWIYACYLRQLWDPAQMSATWSNLLLPATSCVPYFFICALLHS
jgi:hypothetical protein